MRLWSRGLGRLILPLEMRAARVDLTADHVVLSGTIREGKVIWDYRVKMDDRDFLAFCGHALRPDVLHFLARHRGAGLLGALARDTIGFVGGLLRKACGRGSPVIQEDELPVQPRGAGRTRRGGRGVLVQGAR